MGFKLWTPDGASEQFGDLDTYEVAENGVLTVRPVRSTGNRPTRIYSQVGWAHVTADSDHDPGKPKAQ